jgi:hypothetical protein
MFDFNYSADMIQTHIRELHREADHQRLVKIARGAHTAAPLARLLGRRLILLGWRLAAAQDGTVRVENQARGRELWVVDVPC